MVHLHTFLNGGRTSERVGFLLRPILRTLPLARYQLCSAILLAGSGPKRYFLFYKLNILRTQSVSLVRFSNTCDIGRAERINDEETSVSTRSGRALLASPQGSAEVEAYAQGIIVISSRLAPMEETGFPFPAVQLQP